MSLEVINFGCRLNAAESETVRRHAEAAGLADAVIINSCAVTAEAVRQARQAIRRVARERPGVRVIVTGCAAQTEPATFAAMPEVDRVLGNASKTAPATWVETKRALDFDIGGEEKVKIDDFAAVRETAQASPPSLAQWVSDLVPTNVFKAAADGALLPLIVVSIAFGLALTQVGRERQASVVRSSTASQMHSLFW